MSIPRKRKVEADHAPVFGHDTEELYVLRKLAKEVRKYLDEDDCDLESAYDAFLQLGKKKGRKN